MSRTLTTSDGIPLGPVTSPPQDVDGFFAEGAAIVERAERRKRQDALLRLRVQHSTFFQGCPLYTKRPYVEGKRRQFVWKQDWACGCATLEASTSREQMEEQFVTQLEQDCWRCRALVEGRK
jgi:hypothetical protein